MFSSDPAPTASARLSDRLRSAAQLLHDFLTLADEYDVDWGLDDELNIASYEHPHRRMLRRTPRPRRAGEATPAPQQCVPSRAERLSRAPLNRERGTAA
jgi:hypothetical protein